MALNSFPISALTCGKNMRQAKRFFASQGSYGFLLAQENRYLISQLLPQHAEGDDK